MGGVSMITFDQTLDAVERINELLKSAEEAEGQVVFTLSDLYDFASMLKFAHRKQFQNADEALEYIDNVLTPRLNGIINALESGTESHFKRLNVASEHTQRLMLNLQMVTSGGDTGLTS
jgi:hypothetical protein